MTFTINVHAAKTNFSKILKRAESGEEIIIAKAGNPVAKLIPLNSKKKRVLGMAKGRVRVDDSFFEPLPDDLMDHFS